MPRPTGAPELPRWRAYYRRVRDGLGYRKDAAADTAPSRPTRTATRRGEGGAQQPGMTGQVKEEILTRWGELGYCACTSTGCARRRGGALDWARVPCRIGAGRDAAARPRRWIDCRTAFDPGCARWRPRSTWRG